MVERGEFLRPLQGRQIFQNKKGELDGEGNKHLLKAYCVSSTIVSVLQILSHKLDLVAVDPVPIEKEICAFITEGIPHFVQRMFLVNQILFFPSDIHPNFRDVIFSFY